MKLRSLWVTLSFTSVFVGWVTMGVQMLTDPTFSPSRGPMPVALTLIVFGFGMLGLGIVAYLWRWALTGKSPLE